MAICISLCPIRSFMNLLSQIYGVKTFIDDLQTFPFFIHSQKGTQKNYTYPIEWGVVIYTFENDIKYTAS